ncbi:fatty acid desaturase [Streptomyces sp. WZ-12]|uniref:fatty acid desaturase n=1 Tax=Streptomyces sp. WZ-12 TaxID=3030210 RepID=UPI002380FB62|nr:fatty acid desaturase [Streptomyces sp. WZ-12]
MLLCLAVITLGIALRQVDRAWFARGRPRSAAAPELISLQRRRANNVTPVLLLAGQWVQITGWWLLARQGPLPAATAAVGVAVAFRHLQEISHFAVHGVLARSAGANRLLGEVFAHVPLGFVPVETRRRRHVRDHHPHATLSVDPNLSELRAAGLRPGVAPARFAAALLFPLTPRGLRSTLTSIAGSLRHSPGRAAGVGAVLVASYLVGEAGAVVCGVLVPRLLLYPQLAWLSLVVEHTWFDPEHRSGSPAEVEAGRCLRLYPRNRLLATLASVLWLPYGDLHHYAHSAHPSVRWGYLPALERFLGDPHFTPAGLVLGEDSVAGRHLRALGSTPASPAGAEARPAV